MTISDVARQCVAWSGNDEYIAAAAYHRVYVRSALTGEPLAEMEFDEVVVSITMSHDGQYLAICPEEGGIWFWDVMEGKKRDLKGEVAVSAVSFAEDGKQLVFGLRDGTVRIWDLEKEAAGESFIGHSNPVWAVSFLDQEHVVSRSGFRMVLVWNVKTRERVTRTDVPTGTIHTAVHTHYFYFDKSRVKSGFDVCSWTEATKKEEIDWGSYESLTAAFSTDGTLVATYTPDHVHVWHTGDGSLAGGPFSAREVACLAFSADGRRIASGSGDGSLHVWNIQRVDEDGNEANDRQAPFSVEFMPDGERIVVGRQFGSVEVLDASTGHEVGRISEGNNIHWDNKVSLNDNWIASATGNCLRIWTRTGKAVAGPLTSIDNNIITSLALSPGSSDLVAYVTSGCTICVLSASTGASVGQKKFITYYSIFGSCLALTQTHLAVGIEGKITMWDRMTDKIARPFISRGEVTALMFSSDGRYITSVASDFTLCLWDSSNGKIVRGPVKARGGYSNFSVLALDGRKVAFKGIDDTILVFEVLYKGDSDIALDNALVLAGHLDTLHRFALSTDGQYLATPSRDRTIRIWDLRAALKRKQLLIGSASDNSEVINLDECWIDSDGWFAPTNGVDHQQLQRRLFWVPSIQRSGLCRPSNVCVIGQKETWLDIENFVHGEKWDECLLGQ